MFQADANPTADEIRIWASDPDATRPSEDWELVLATISDNDSLYLELAGSELPGSDTFLRCLYIIFGDAVRTSWRTRSRTQVETLVESGLRSMAASVRKWAEAAARVLAHPKTFSAEDWIYGGAVSDEDAL
jgi:hypothetical protein